MWSNLWDAWCPSVFILLTDWVIICLCVCCFLSVWLQGWSHVQEWAPPLPRWQAWPQWVNVHYHMKLPPPPHYSHLSFSVGQCTWTLALQHKHAYLLLFVHTQIYSVGRKWQLMARIPNSGSTTYGNKVVKRNPFVSITLKRLVVLTDWLAD